jgi:hypothetical protein
MANDMFGDLFSTIGKTVSTPTKPSSVFTEEVLTELEQDDLAAYRKIQTIIDSILINENFITSLRSNQHSEIIDNLLSLRKLAETYR